MLYQIPQPSRPLAWDNTPRPPSVEMPPIPLAQPDIARYARQQLARYRSDAPPRLDGATQHESFLFAVGQPQIRLSYQIPRAKAPIDVAAAAVTQTDIPPFTTQPDRGWFVRLERVRSLGGSAPSLAGATVTTAPTYVFPVNQPELAYQLPLRRLLPQTGPSPQLLGQFVTSAQTYVFPVNQADFAREAAKHAIRFVVEAPRRLDGATVQQTYIFAPSQPDYRFYSRVTPAAPSTPIPGVFIPPAQTYEFTPNQPDLRRFSALELARRLGWLGWWQRDVSAFNARLIRVTDEHLSTADLSGELLSSPRVAGETLIDSD
jgi:hypothetical protein